MLDSFLYFLFGENRKPLYKKNGLIMEGDENYQQPDGQLAKIEKSPIGWKDSLVKYARNLTSLGTLRTMSVPMRFVKDGYDILKYLLSTRGIETIAFLGILKFNRYVLPYEHDVWYLSELDFSKYVHARDAFEIQAVEGGFTKIMKAFEKQTYDISVVDDPEKQVVKLDGINLFMSATYETLDSTFAGPTDINMPAMTIPIYALDPDGNAPYVRLNNQYQTTAIPFDNPSQPNIYGYMVESDNYFLIIEDNAPGPVLVELEGKFSINMIQKHPNESPIYVRLWHVKRNMVVGNGPDDLNLNKATTLFHGAVTQFAPQMKNYIDGTTSYEIPWNKSFLMEAGDRLFYTLEFYAPNNTDLSTYAFAPTSYLTVKYNTKYETTYVDGLYVSRVIEKIIDKMIEDQYLLPWEGSRLKSTWLYGKKDLVITSGDLLRRIENGTIKTSLMDALLSLRHYGCGWASDVNKLTVEQHPYFFRQDVILDLGEIGKEAELKSADDLLYNTLEVGGPEVDYEFINGKFEPNQLQRWHLPITRKVETHDLTTPWRRDPYGVEDMRINNAGKKTTDTNGDNDTFMLSVEPGLQDGGDGFTAHHRLYRPVGVITGVPDPVGIFNLDLTPKRSIVNNMPYIGALCDKVQDRPIKFDSAEKNRELTSYGLDEDAPTQGGTAVPLFLPHYFKISTKVPLNLTEILGNEPYGKVRFTLLGREWFGYLWDGGVKPADNDTQTWTLLACAGQDLNKWYEPL